ncbi:ADF/Cofilin/Destrin [Carpediemonas membranifera]|uniref:ADF/Cofilin/Destrin n=1 Tax=Carpediemonas membranifera TaxID=201153 RepID=A0A8J6AZF7_9EUKA|nr:ADF/Cofilin/Destrin [Carpediemonas membranifera]|eukprot:KAG9396065.1 ADF/Cofilin/Destrin [Carpediemonas membranifera]
MSGVSVGEACVKIYEEMKMSRKYKYATFRVNEDLTEIIPDAVGEPDADFEEFVSKFPEKDARYGILDVDYEDDGCAKSRIVFIFWSPDGAPIRSKMVYASSKESLRRQFAGIMTEVQGNDLSDITMDEIKGRILRV